MKTIKELEEEIKKASSKNCIIYDNGNKWRPIFYQLCGNNYTSRGIDKHLKQIHGIVRFDGGIRDAELKQTKEIVKIIEKKIKEYEKYWLDAHNKKDKQAEDIFYNTLHNLEELLRRITGVTSPEVNK